MKRKIWMSVGCVMLAGLAGCQGGKKTVAESCWREAQKAQDFSGYVEENADRLDVEALKKEADAPESTLSQQFKAAALLAALEEQKSDGEDSAAYANGFLQKVTTEGEAFWVSLEEAFYPYDCFESLFMAADQIDAQTMTALISGIPDDSSYADGFRSAIGKWVEKNPAMIIEIGDVLMQEEFYSEWKADDWESTYFYSYTDQHQVWADNVDQAMAYVGYLRSSLLPRLESEFGEEEFKASSELTGEAYFDTKMTVDVPAELQLMEPATEGLPETIEVEGRKVAAFYRNLQEADFKDSPAALRVLGDFMLGLPEEEFPASLAEADYYLVLTPEYEYGEFYQDRSGNDTRIQEVTARTSIDLYEAGSGTYLKHLGTVQESPSSTIFKDTTEEGAQYPETTSADILSYIYHNVNQPDMYVTLLDNTVGIDSELKGGESVILGNWEITYQSAQIAASFDEGMFRYTAGDGNVFIRAEMTITNRGTKKDTFLPMVYDSSKDPIVQIFHPQSDSRYDCVDAVTDSRCLNDTSLEPGESESGEVIFEVPEEVAQGEEPVRLMVSLGRQNVLYLLGE